jgi:Protein of unknown function (DUF2934)
MNEKSDRKELERRLEQAKRAAALFNDPVTTERLLKLVKDLEEQLREADDRPKVLFEAYGSGPAHSSSRKPAMENPTEKQIVRRAYELWEQAGKPEGRDQEFYHLAEQELRDADKSSPLRTPDNL